MEQIYSKQYAWCQKEKICTYLDDITDNLKNGSNQEKSIAKVLEQMKRGSKIKQQDTNLLIVVGITGTGKTTFSAYISGLNLKVISEDFGDEQEPKLSYCDNINQVTSAIGMSDTDSETQQPNFFWLDKQTMIVDCPGLLDSRGVEVDLANSYCLSKAIQNSKNIKFLITLDGQSFQQQTLEKGKTLKATLEAIFFLAFKNTQNRLFKQKQFYFLCPKRKRLDDKLSNRLAMYYQRLGNMPILELKLLKYE
ncbi:hypothetical protein ABPG72_016371 [Tetrahymena utriculariae]